MMSTNEKDFAWADAVGKKGSWYQLRPAGEDFTALVPENGKQVDTEVPVGGAMVNVTGYLARDGWSTYFVQWIKAGSFGESNRAALDDAMMNFAMGVNQGLGPYASKSCGPKNEKYISVSGLPGIEFELVSCTLRGRVRVVTRLVGEQRQMYVMAALFIEEDDNVPRFLNSLTIDTPKHRKKR